VLCRPSHNPTPTAPEEDYEELPEESEERSVPQESSWSHSSTLGASAGYRDVFQSPGDYLNPAYLSAGKVRNPVDSADDYLHPVGLSGRQGHPGRFQHPVEVAHLSEESSRVNNADPNPNPRTNADRPPLPSRPSAQTLGDSSAILRDTSSVLPEASSARPKTTTFLPNTSSITRDDDSNPRDVSAGQKGIVLRGLSESATDDYFARMFHDARAPLRSASAVVHQPPHNSLSFHNREGDSTKMGASESGSSTSTNPAQPTTSSSHKARPPTAPKSKRVAGQAQSSVRPPDMGGDLHVNNTKSYFIPPADYE
jgi:hypothetical protein